MSKKEPKCKVRAHGAINYPVIEDWGGGYHVIKIPSGTVGGDPVFIPEHSLREFAEYFIKCADYLEQH